MSEQERAARPAVPALDWPTLANVIREVDGNHNLGAGELAERILTHPKVLAASATDEGPLRAALDAYEADPVNVNDRPESWAKLDALLEAVRAALAASATDEPRPKQARIRRGRDANGIVQSWEEPVASATDEGPWKEDARRYAQNADYWRDLYEKAAATIEALEPTNG